ncbi:STAS domain-containing protein [Roseiflexus sp.]|uniref:STAS domain-containing protein n=1 Tax=Roseiflexus sp. TaxID=2562120 RepID=UPI0021DDE1CB|nr:STAS domain-containing protein [Roseiflexus sp.]GIW00191.1 MAG: anti-sigma factor antagonist [Roseiflexus sp.]
MMITQRQVTIGALAIVTGGNILFSILLGLNQGVSGAAVPGISAIIDLVLLIAYLRGWSHAPNVLIVIVSVTAAFALNILPRDGVVGIPMALLFPAALALAMTTPPWLIAGAILTAAICSARVFTSGFALNVVEFIVYVMLVGILLLARAVLNATVQQANELRRRAEQAQARTEEQARALEAANAAQQAQLDEQRRLLDLVATLETPAITLANGVLFAPIVGHLDSRRSARLTARLLKAAHDQRAHHVIIDISGVSTVDTAVAQALINAAQALKLLGCRVTLSGISSEVALTLTQQDVPLRDIATARSPQEALTM